MPTIDLNGPFEIKPPSKRDMAKAAIYYAIQEKTKRLTRRYIDTYTGLDEDSIRTRIAGNVVGQTVAWKAKKYTDKLVDKTADWYVARQESKTEKDQKDEKDTNDTEK